MSSVYVSPLALPLRSSGLLTCPVPCSALPGERGRGLDLRFEANTSPTAGTRLLVGEDRGEQLVQQEGVIGIRTWLKTLGDEV
ncbi:MAG: hypothetical protein JKY65_10990 [Planctomycetes bacterium]|nr:hypothetical protein [Planctomycetota bacterium]